MKSYNHFSENERFFIDCAFNVEHKSIREIAKILGKSPSSVSREIKRNSNQGDYVSAIADKFQHSRKWNTNGKFRNKYFEFTQLFLKYFDKRVHGVYPTMNKIKTQYPNVKQPSARQVFRWIRSDSWVVTRKSRLRYQYKKGGKRQNGFFNKIFSKYVQPLWVRPRHINLRKEFGHWEGDLIVGKKSNNYKNIVTLNERKTRILFATFVETNNPWKINSAFRRLIKQNKLNVKTLTLDNGVEFGKIALLAKWCDLTVYTCEPYSSFQRGSNENLNGLIRRFWKKGTDFNFYDEHELQLIVNEINNMPRKMFDWKSSSDMYKKELLAFSK